MGPRTLSELRVGAPLRAGAVTIVPVEEVLASVQCVGARVFGSGGKRVAAVVVTGASGSRAWDDAGHPLDLAELLNRVPDLREELK